MSNQSATATIIQALHANMNLFESMNGPERVDRASFGYKRSAKKTHVIGNAPAEYANVEGQGRVKVPSYYQLSLALSHVAVVEGADLNSVVLELQLFTQGIGIEEKLQLPILASVEQTVERFEREAWLWKMNAKSVEEGVSMIQKIHASLNSMRADLRATFLSLKPHTKNLEVA